MSGNGITMMGLAMFGAFFSGCSFNLETKVDIQAPPSEVWKHLTHFEAYPKWNSFIKKIEGKLEKGAKLRVTIQACESDPMEFTPKVLKVENEREFRWKGRVLMPGIFDGEHSFRIERLPGGASRLIQAEKFSGILVPFFKGMLKSKTRCGFEAMNKALKSRSEGW